MPRILCAVSLFLFVSEVAGQDMVSLVPVTSAEARMVGFERKMSLVEASLVSNVALHNIGPTIMSGRITDVDVNPYDPTEIYVAYASGGLWKSSNNGQSFEPLFDHQMSMTIGDIAVDWDHSEVIWVGTGENNSSRSSYAGTGVYKSMDGGQTWDHLGLEETHHIGRIVLHPEDPETVWVAAIGSLYSAGPDRGVYKTTDGGATWQRILYRGERVGAIDLVIDPSDPRVLYAALWERERRAWNFVESGEGSSIWKTTNGGADWSRLDGFPAGPGIGRIGLDAYAGDGSILYALLDNQDRRPPEDEEPKLTRDALREMGRDEFLALDTSVVQEYLDDNRFSPRYGIDDILEKIRSGEIEPVHLVWYVEDANRELFETPVIGAEVYRSDDAGATWTKTHEEHLDGVYNSYGYYFGEIRIAPHDSQRVYILGVPLLRSDDGGATWQSIGGASVHADHHALWLNSDRPGHLVNGNDGGLNISYDDGANWFKANTPSVGQFYAIGVDNARPYHVYGGLQDNGVWGGPHTYERSVRWHAGGAYPYERYLGGDGMQVEVDTRTNDIVYTGSQFGFYVRIEKGGTRPVPIRPTHTLGERPLRYNWQTPIHLSRHNQDVLYFGSNKLHRSFNRGDDWETLSDDLTQGGRKGDVPFGTLTSIDESPLRFGLLYTGSDDGFVHVSRDGGYGWERISDSLPQDLWVSRVEASHHALGRVYVTLNGYRWDNFESFVYRSDDFGATWQSIGENLPAEPVNVIVEDPESENLLYLGTDHGLYLSVDGGETFMAMGGGLPFTSVHDLKIQARARDLLVGTHGRSIWRADVSEVQQLTPDVLAKPLHVFDPGAVRHSEGWGNSLASWRDPFVPEVELTYYSATTQEVTIRILTKDDVEVHTFVDAAEHGLNYVTYDLSVDEGKVDAFAEGEDDQLPMAADNGVVYLPIGTYAIEVSGAGATATGRLNVNARP